MKHYVIVFQIHFELQPNTMGIHGLAKLIADQAPGAIKEQDIKNYFGNYYRSPSLLTLTIMRSAKELRMGSFNND